MLTATRGNTGEAAVLSALVRRGFAVLIPFGDGHPYDLVVDVAPGALIRIQCKTAWRKGGCMLFNCLSTDHGNGPQPYHGRADMFGVYFPPENSVYLVPIEEMGRGKGTLRLEATRNNQRRRIRFADDYEMGRWSRDDLEALVRGAPVAPELNLAAL